MRLNSAFLCAFFTAVVLFSTFAVAKPNFTQSTANMPKTEFKKDSPTGIRLGLVTFPGLKLTGKLGVQDPVSGQKAMAKDSMNIDPSFGLHMGYNMVSMNEVGFAGGLTLAELDIENDKYAFARLEGNLTYGLAPEFFLKGGLNVSKFTESPIDELDPEIGFQFMGSLKLMPNIYVDAGYVIMNQKENNKFNSVKLEESGLEFALVGTF